MTRPSALKESSRRPSARRDIIKRETFDKSARAAEAEIVNTAVLSARLLQSLVIFLSIILQKYLVALTFIECCKSNKNVKSTERASESVFVIDALSSLCAGGAPLYLPLRKSHT